MHGRVTVSPLQLGSAGRDSCISMCRCRPVRVVHPPAENVCLVGQQTGRIKWIQPSGAAIINPVMSYPATAPHVLCTACLHKHQQRS